MKLKSLLILLLTGFSAFTMAEDGKALFAAAIAGKTDRVEALLARGIDVNSTTGNGKTSLMGASFNGNVRVVKVLLGYGANTNLADNAGTTALMDALVFGNKEIINLLLAAGADINAVDKQNISVLARAKQSTHPGLVQLLEQAGAKEHQDQPATETEEPTSTDPTKQKISENTQEASPNE
jgi:uncharacterized protein